jgi:hypothetical protein
MQRRSRKVIAICAFTVGGLAIAGHHFLQFPHACRFTDTTLAHAYARELRAAAWMWQERTPSKDCPTIARLKEDRALDPEHGEIDPWGVPFRIECHDDEITVASSGPDRQWKTQDDIAVPRSP